MHGRLTAALAAALLFAVVPAEAQQAGAAAPAQAPATQSQAEPARQGHAPSVQQDQPTSAAQGAPSAEAMGISLKGIRRNLDRMPQEKKSTATGLRYDFFVDVLGKRPPVEFFRDFDLSTKGGVRWGSPTHAEILHAVSPTWVTGGMPYGGFDLLSIGRK